MPSALGMFPLFFAQDIMTQLPLRYSATWLSSHVTPDDLLRHVPMTSGNSNDLDD